MRTEEMTKAEGRRRKSGIHPSSFILHPCLCLLLGLVALLPAQRLDRTILLPDSFTGMHEQGFVAVNPLNSHVYVASRGDSHIVVIDGNSRQPIARIPTGCGIGGLLFAPELNRLYAGAYSRDGTDPSLRVIDGATSQVLRTIPVGPNVCPMLFIPERHKLYCTVADSAAGLRVVDTQSDSVIAAIAVPIPGRQLAYSPQSGHLYYYASNYADVYVIDAASDAVLRVIPTTQGLNGLCYSSAGNRFYVSTNVLRAYDATTDSMLAEIDVGGRPNRLLYDSVSGHVYCGTNESSVVVLNGADNTIHHVYQFNPYDYANPVAINPLTNRVYLAYSDSLWVVDDNLDSVIARTNYGVATMNLDPVLNRWYWLNWSTNDHLLHLFDGATSALLPPIRLGFDPQRLCFNAAIGKLYCSDANGAIAVLRPDLGRADTIVETGNGIDKMLVNPATNRVYALTGAPAPLVVLDGTTNQIVTRIAIGHSIGDVVLNPTLNRIYANGWSDSSITVVDGNSDTVLATIRLSFRPAFMDFNPAFDRLYVTEGGRDSVAVIDGASNSVISEISVLPSPGPLAWDPLDGRLYCGSGGDAGVAVINCVSGQEVRRIAGPQSVAFLAINTVENKVYALCEGGDQATIAVISADRDSLLTTLPAWGYPYDAGEWYYHAAANRLFICGDETWPGMVEIIDGHSDEVTGLITVCDYPVALAADSANGNLYVADDNSSSISVIRAASGLAEPAELRTIAALSIAPNPCRGLLRIRALGGSGTQEVTIHDVTGRLVRRLTVKPGATTELDLRDQHSGVYFASTAEPKRGTLHSIKFLLMR